RDQSLAELVGSVEVRLHRDADLVDGFIEDAFRCAVVAIATLEIDAGIVDQHIEAPDLPPQMAREPLDAGGIGHVESAKGDVEPRVRESLGRGAPLGWIARRQDDRVAALRQLPADLEPDSP